MIIEIIRHLHAEDRICIITMIFLVFVSSCNKKKECSVNSNEKLLQEYKTNEEVFSLWSVDHGVYGSDVSLRICNIRNNEFIEEIGLRGEDCLPQIDSVTKDNVYIHYSFPAKDSENKIDFMQFESVVLGDALLHKTNLKYNYVFINIPIPTEK